MSEFLQVAEQAARAAGRVLRDLSGRVQIREKGPKDLVTEADLAAQRVIRDILLGAFPGHQFLGEEDLPETDGPRERPGDYCWVVDPLDGTTNYSHQLPQYSVSIALVRNDQVQVGLVYDPSLDEVFSAEAGRGAALNGVPIQTSRCQHLAAALVAASFSANVPRGSTEIARFVEVLHSAQALRRMGSAALNLCYLAAGRLDAYWATSVKSWDVAAGWLLVREAGGMVTGVDGGPFDWRQPHFAAASTPALHGELLEVLLRASRSGQ
ncbi:MAG: inositol monophosphatase [Pirellulaceae bacterium]|nr:inositol monophosphatase [Pirellulaceae bacterium]